MIDDIMEDGKKKQSLSQAFKEVVDEYFKRFHQQLDLDPTYSWWVGDEVGTTLLFCNGEYSLGFDNIRYIVDRNIAWEEFSEWWETNMSHIHDSEPLWINLRAWHHGFRPEG